MLADTSGHAETEVGVDVDFANSHGSSFAELVFRDADSIGEMAVVSIDDFDVFRNDGRCAVEHDREAREAFGNVFEDIETEFRRNEDAFSVACALIWCEFVCAVARADSDC